MSNLIISTNHKQALSQNQLAFNKLTARIEKLHKDIGKKQLLFDKALAMYSNSIHPLRMELSLQNRRALEILWPVYQSKKFAVPDQKLFKEVLQHALSEVFHYDPTSDEPDDFLKEIFGELEGISYEAAQKEEDDDMKEDMQSMFDQMGIDIDLTALDTDDPKSFAEKLAEAQQRIKDIGEQQYQQQQHWKRHTPKTAKQLEKEKMQLAVEEMKQKNISTIYKQLAKLFHPDLEQDETLRAEKQLLMQELTAAYEAKNLHTLLSLEMKWIHKENDHLGTLSEEKLKVYLQILKEQAAELEREKLMIFQQPRYAVLLQQYDHEISTRPVLTLEREEARLQGSINSLKKDIVDFQSKEQLKHIKALLKAWKKMQKEKDDELDFFDMLLNKRW